MKISENKILKEKNEELNSEDPKIEQKFQEKEINISENRQLQRKIPRK
jgi:hypothetical protein